MFFQILVLLSSECNRTTVSCLSDWWTKLMNNTILWLWAFAAPLRSSCLGLFGISDVRFIWSYGRLHVGLWASGLEMDCLLHHSSRVKRFFFFCIRRTWIWIRIFLVAELPPFQLYFDSILERCSKLEINTVYVVQFLIYFIFELVYSAVFFLSKQYADHLLSHLRFSFNTHWNDWTLLDHPIMSMLEKMDCSSTKPFCESATGSKNIGSCIFLI